MILPSLQAFVSQATARTRDRSDPAFLARIQTRFSQVATHGSQPAVLEEASTPLPEKEAGGSQ
jgi:hypothetical protein